MALLLRLPRRTPGLRQPSFPGYRTQPLNEAGCAIALALDDASAALIGVRGSVASRCLLTQAVWVQLSQPSRRRQVHWSGVL